MFRASLGLPFGSIADDNEETHSLPGADAEVFERYCHFQNGRRGRGGTAVTTNPRVARRRARRHYRLRSIHPSDDAPNPGRLEKLH